MYTQKKQTVGLPFWVLTYNKSAEYLSFEFIYINIQLYNQCFTDNCKHGVLEKIAINTFRQQHKQVHLYMVQHLYINNILKLFCVQSELHQLHKALGIVHRTSAAYRSQNQVITESYNSSLINMLRCYINEDQKDWNRYVKLVTLAYNSGAQASTGQQVILFITWF